MAELDWEVSRHAEPVGAFHARALPDPARRQVWVAEPTGPALVLGSAQPDSDADRAACRRLGLDVVRRRSGGGAVLVVPGDLLWVDVVVPAGDPLWQDDVGHAFHWLGDVWARALASLGVAGRVHRGALVASRWSRLVCFAGLGPGEVVMGPQAAGAPAEVAFDVQAPGAPAEVALHAQVSGAPTGGTPATQGLPVKVVGISQRRTRVGARFQCSALLAWDPSTLVDALAEPPEGRAAVLADVAPRAGALALPPDDILQAFLHHLPR